MYDDWMYDYLLGNKEYNLKLIYRVSSISEFYRLASVCTPTGHAREHTRYLRGDVSDWFWLGVKNFPDLLSKKFTYKKGIVEIEKESQKMVQGYRKHIYKWDELDGDDLSMERLYEQLPALRKRISVTGDKFGNFISLYFNVGNNCGIQSGEMLSKTKTAIKLIKFFESLNKRVEVVIYSNDLRPGTYNNEGIHSILLEVVAKKFSEPLNIGLLNTTLTPWFFRYWVFMFWHSRCHLEPGYGHSVDVNPEDIKSKRKNKAIILNAQDALDEYSSNEFIEKALNNEKTSTF